MSCLSAQVIGAGLAGCEAAWAMAERGVKVCLFEMRPEKTTPAHKTGGLAELVCSNSLKADRAGTASGLLKAEMRLFGSLILETADECRVPAGGALAVDRDLFSETVTEKVSSHKNIELIRAEVTSLPKKNAVIASGPLTSEPLAHEIVKQTGQDNLFFFDAAAPIITAASVDRSVVFGASRYGRGDDDYLNCPFNRDEYIQFVNELTGAKRAPVHDFEAENPKVYEGCMPVEVLASRGEDSLRFGPLRPVGLTDPKTGSRPWAVLQLRRENREGTLLNLVGFQTNLKFSEQQRVFRLVPGLENAEFVRFGVMHRNTFLNSPFFLDEFLRFKGSENIFFAGQLTGTEGYVEAAAGGILAGVNLFRMMQEKPPLKLPPESMLGALTAYLSGYTGKDFQPMGANMGLLPPLPERIRGKKERFERLHERSLTAMKTAFEAQEEMFVS